MNQILIAGLLLLGSFQAEARNFAGKVIMSACDMSTASCTSKPIDMKFMDNVAIQATFTGSPVGTFKVQISSDVGETGGAVVTWSDYTGASAAITTAGDVMFNLSGAG